MEPQHPFSYASSASAQYTGGTSFEEFNALYSCLTTSQQELLRTQKGCLNDHLKLMDGYQEDLERQIKRVESRTESLERLHVLWAKTYQERMDTRPGFQETEYHQELIEIRQTLEDALQTLNLMRRNLGATRPSLGKMRKCIYGAAGALIEA